MPKTTGCQFKCIKRKNKRTPVCGVWVNKKIERFKYGGAIFFVIPSGIYLGYPRMLAKFTLYSVCIHTDIHTCRRSIYQSKICFSASLLDSSCILVIELTLFT